MKSQKKEAVPIAKAVPFSGSAPVGIVVVDSSKAAAGGWSSGLCDCASDCTSCWATVFCRPTVLGQLYEKLSRRPRACLIIATLLWLSALFKCGGAHLVTPVAAVLSVLPGSPDWLAHGVSSSPDWHMETVQVALPGERDVLSRSETVIGTVYVPSPTQQLVASLASLLFFGSLVVTCAVRRAIRQRDDIAATTCESCGGFDDALHALVCYPCVTCQLMRHEGLTSGHYSLCAPTGRKGFV